MTTELQLMVCACTEEDDGFTLAVWYPGGEDGCGTEGWLRVSQEVEPGLYIGSMDNGRLTLTPTGALRGSLN